MKDENIDIIRDRILLIRGQRVMLDSDLAELYQIQTKVLLQSIRRNINRFPEDFMFQLSREESLVMWSQIVTTSESGKLQKYRRKEHLPYAFTEHGVAMLSSVLKSDVAVAMNIFIIRAFIKMREYMLEYKDVALKIEKLEGVVKDDHNILQHVHTTLRRMIEKPDKPKRIGFNQ